MACTARHRRPVRPGVHPEHGRDPLRAVIDPTRTVPRSREALVVVAVLAVVALGGVVMIAGGMTGGGNPASAVGAHSSVGVPGAGASGGGALCSSQRLAVDGGVYTVHTNEWGSGAAECLALGGLGGFTVTRSAIANSTSGAPGGYPSIYRGCHWGACTLRSGLPVPVSRLLSPGTVTTTWATAQPRTGAYDVAYDIWFNREIGRASCRERV